MYLKEILDAIGNSVNDTTLKSTGTNASRTKSWVQQFYYLDLMPRRDWSFGKKQDTITTTSGTQRYNFPRWVDNPKRVENLINPTTYLPLTQSILKDVTGKYDLTIYNTPAEYVIGPRVRTTYTTGTLSGTSSTKVLTGSGTSWTTSNIAQFDYIQIGSYAYTVNSVDSDTQITIFEDIVTTIAAATTYTALLDRWTLDLFPVPNATLALILYASQIVPRLDDDFDVPIIPDNWHWILVKAGVIKALQHNQEDVSVEIQELERSIRMLISEDQSESDRIETVDIPRSRSY